MTNETQPFDQDLYAKILDVLVNPKPYESDEDQASRIVAIVAARQPAPVVGDEEELLSKFYGRKNWYLNHTDMSGLTDDEVVIAADRAGIRAVREALAARALQVPQIPEGWHLQLLDWHSTDEEYQVEMYYYGNEDEGILLAEGCHPTDPFEAIRDAIRDAGRHTAAIERAKGGQE